MQKFLNIAEQYIQWVALGVGVLYLALMGWSYVYQPNINVTLGPKVVEPGEIEKVIAEGPIKELDEKINSDTAVDITPPDVVTAWTNGIEDKKALVENIPSVFGTNPDGGVGANSGPVNPVTDQQKLAVLPKIPAAVPVAVAAYRTMIEFPDPNFDAANAAPGAAVPLIDKDIDAASVEFKVDSNALAKAFGDAFNANPNPKLFQTMYLRVHLWREEQNANGGWDAPTEIPALSINKPADYPKDPVGQQSGLVYNAWALANQDLMIHPPFFQIAKGAPPWYMPDQAPAAAAPAAAQPDANPAVAPDGPRPGAPLRGRQPAQPGQALPPPGQVGTDQPRPNMFQPPGAFAGPFGAADRFSQPVASMEPLAAGMFDPRAKLTDDVIVAHDDTVQPDKTYRYYVQYVLYNPLFFANRIAADALARQFDVKSPDIAVAKDADKTQKITIPSRTQIFLASVQGGAAAHVKIFQWKPTISETEVVGAPGDLLAPSPYTLVDIRQDMSTPAHAWYVLLVNADGKEVRRDLLKDKADPNFLQWEKDAAAANPAAALAN
jgi:hypothetical protein